MLQRPLSSHCRWCQVISPFRRGTVRTGTKAPPTFLVAPPKFLVGHLQVQVAKCLFLEGGCPCDHLAKETSETYIVELLRKPSAKKCT